MFCRLTRVAGGLRPDEGAGRNTRMPVATVQTALDVADHQAFELDIGAIGLPGRTGYEVMQWMRDRGSTKGIALSGYGMERIFARARKPDSPNTPQIP